MKHTYTYKKQWKLALLIMAIIIGVLSLSYTNTLVKKMKIEERKNMETWAEATSYLANVDDQGQDFNFYLNIITKNTTIPVILCDSDGIIVSVGNIKEKKENNEHYLQKKIEKMAEEHDPIIIQLLDGETNAIYYEDSTILRQLSIYPYIQIGVITLFILIAYFAFSSSRKAEQNQVWVGMSKETAHQLGTPISSLMAWLEILEQNNENHDYLKEMHKDIARLETITDRFSKIGSKPDLPLSDLKKTLDLAIQYMQTRTSGRIKFEFNYNGISELILPLSKSLFNWVIENLIKNAVDAMGGEGNITTTLSETDNEAIIRIIDTGKGIQKSKHKAIFKPGVTSKDRGWGLGLSLTHRIIEQYHNGKIQVEYSELDQGTTFKIVLPK